MSSTPAASKPRNTKNSRKRSAAANSADPATAKRDATLSRTLESIEKNWGTGSVMRLGDRPKKPIASVSTGSLALDAAIGIGGLPRGRIVEVFGPESSGKTTLALHVIASAQRRGGICAIIDAEHALDPSYARKIGVDIENLLVSQPDCGEHALAITEELIASGALDVVVIDSVAALVPRAEIEGQMGDSHVALQARLMSQALRKLTATIARTNTTAIFINQLREKIGVMFGSPTTTPGGRALKFYSSVRLDIRRIGQIKDGEKVVGNRTKVSVVKNKGRAAVLQVRVRHPLRPWHRPHRRTPGTRRAVRARQAVRQLVRLWRHETRPRPWQGVRVPDGARQPPDVAPA